MVRWILVSAFALSWLSAAHAQAGLGETGFEEAADYSAARKGISFLVVVNGKVVAEDYRKPGSRNFAFELASGTKSFSCAIAAAAAQDGLFALDTPISDIVPEWQDQERRPITIRQMLSLTAGIDSNKRGRNTLTYEQAIALQPSQAPGTKFEYDSAPFQIFGEVVRRSLSAHGKNEDPAAYLQQRLFDPLGVTPHRWTRGADGMPRMSSGIALTARQWAGFGEVIRQGGMLNQTPLMSSDALAACFQGTEANPAYGLGWWLNTSVSETLLRQIPQLTRGGDITGFDELGPIWMAAGAGKQRLYVLPDYNATVVRQARGILDALRGKGTDWSDQTFLGLIKRSLDDTERRINENGK